MPSSAVQSISTRGSMWMRLWAMPYSLAFAMIWSSTRIRSAAVLGMPVSSQSRAMTCHLVSAITGNTISILLPSPETELMSPGRSQYFIASTHTWAEGLSMEMGVSVTLWMRPIIQPRVSTSSTSTLAQQSMKSAPASACFFAMSRIHSSFRSAMALPMEGMEPLIFSPMIIIAFFLSAFISVFSRRPPPRGSPGCWWSRCPRRRARG